MQRRAFFSTLAAAGVVTACRPAAAAVSRQSQAKPTFDLDTLLAVTEVPAIAVAGTIDGKPFQRFAGVGATASKVPVTADTYFPAASLSKPVLAWAVRDLVRQGKLDLAKPLQDYTELGLSADAKRITAEHVLTHSTGLPNWRFQLDKPLTADFVPGSKWQYSGEGIFLLQRVVEKIVGVPIAAYMKKNVLDPLGMTASTYVWSPELQAKAVSGHDRHGLPLEHSSAFYEQRNYEVIQKAGLQAESATYGEIAAAYEKAKAPALPVVLAPNMAGSLWTTPTEYSRFLKRVLADISEHADDYRARVNVNPQIAWTLGWGVDGSFRRPACFHWGDGPGFKNFAWLQPERHLALVLLTNGEHGLQAYSSVLRNLLAAEPAALYGL
jgi:CubicO group peptidase (beta-lactamase class C family)